MRVLLNAVAFAIALAAVLTLVRYMQPLYSGDHATMSAASADHSAILRVLGLALASVLVHALARTLGRAPRRK